MLRILLRILTLGILGKEKPKQIWEEEYWSYHIVLKYFVSEKQFKKDLEKIFGKNLKNARSYHDGCLLYNEDFLEAYDNGDYLEAISVDFEDYFTIVAPAFCLEAEEDQEIEFPSLLIVPYHKMLSDIKHRILSLELNRIYSLMPEIGKLSINTQDIPEVISHRKQLEAEKELEKLKEAS